NQRSSLRVINLGDAMANLTITGVDDGGAAGENSMTDTVPANGATSISAANAEAMGLGDGAGKWSLMVMSDQPIQVMSLMDTPSGHLANLSAGRQEYRGAAGLYQVSFEDGMEGIIVLLSDSRLYAWLPETADVNRIARGTYGSNGRMISGEGVVYESGKIELDGTTPVGGTDDVTLTAAFRSGDWISGTYTVDGDEPRAFHGWAFTGFERGGSPMRIQGRWMPMSDVSDLPATFPTDASGAFDDSITVDSPLGSLPCDFSGRLVAVNPAFNAYHASPQIDCDLIPPFGGEGNEDEVEMVMSIMDAPDKPGMGERAIVFVIFPREVNRIGLGAVFELTRE
ncbi:MAG: hypothetical protein OXE40_16005, partial [Gammaproteobacteria bacterium]|nr:hypothetical protein [Gammaproteobacteria bacterium]